MIHLESPSYELFIIQKNVAEEIQIMFLPLLLRWRDSGSGQSFERGCSL